MPYPQLSLLRRCYTAQVRAREYKGEYRDRVIIAISVLVYIDHRLTTRVRFPVNLRVAFMAPLFSRLSPKPRAFKVNARV